MPYGFDTTTSGFSDTVVEDIQKAVVETLRAGLVSLPKGSVIPAIITGQRGRNFDLTATEYPDLHDSTSTTPLSEGVAPAALQLGISNLQWSVEQSGARTVVTDVAQFQSWHDLASVAADKISRLAAENFDAIARAAIEAGADDIGSSGNPLTTGDLLDMVAEMQARNVMPVPGAGYYCLLHPYALRGLTGESGLSGYIDVTRDAAAGDLTRGAVGQYRGVTFLPSTKFVDTAGAFPVYMLGAASICAGDTGSLTYHPWTNAGPGNELQQLIGIGYKSIFGAKVAAFAEGTDGAGTEDAVTERVIKFDVATGVGS